MITTQSAFNYGHTITQNNNLLNFNEGNGEALATLRVGSYTLTEFLNEVLRALNESSVTLTFSGSIDYATRKLTISSSSSFTLLISSGSNNGSDPFGLIGFTGTDQSGTSLEGDSPSGFRYVPQFLLQNYVSFEDQQESASVSVNRSASGIVEVVKYGDINYMSCTISYITDILGQGVIRNNANGVSDARDFIKYCVTKAPIEFYEDSSTPNYVKCFLSSTSTSKDGTGYTLKELYSRKLAGYYELSNLKFQKVTE